MTFSLKKLLSRNRNAAAAPYYPVVVPLAFAMLVGIAVVYLSMGFTASTRSGSFWPITALFTWGFFTAVANISFFRRERRVMASVERRYFAGLACGVPVCIILGGSAILAIGFKLMGIMNLPEDPAFIAGGPTLTGVVVALVVAAPSSFLLAWLSVSSPIQGWFIAHFPPKK